MKYEDMKIAPDRVYSAGSTVIEEMRKAGKKANPDGWFSSYTCAVEVWDAMISAYFNGPPKQD